MFSITARAGPIKIIVLFANKIYRIMSRSIVAFFIGGQRSGYHECYIVWAVFIAHFSGHSKINSAECSAMAMSLLVLSYLLYGIVY